MWNRLVILAKIFMRFTQVKNFLITVMGKETNRPPKSDDEWEMIDVDPEEPREESNRLWRTINLQGEQYVVGEVLTESKYVKNSTHNPIICQHPAEKMYGRGARADKKWWYCQACGTRWERILLSNFEGTSNHQNGTDLITFGKHAGKTYNTVYVTHPDYCEWILKTAETGDSPSPELLKFAKYLATREARSPDDIPAGEMDEEL